MADFLLPIDVARVVPSSEYSSRDGATPLRHIWHHGATTSGFAIEANMEAGGRELSATLVIHNNGLIVGKVPERFRPHTSSSYRFDREAITSEMANGAIDGWTITDATYQACGRIAAAEYQLYGIPLDRDHHLSHSELYTAKYGWESYPTYCLGPLERVDWIVELGRRNLSGTAGNTPIKEFEMPRLIRHPNGSIGFVSDAGELDAISTLNEVESLKSTGLVGTWVDQPANVWDTLTKRTARLRAARTPGVDVDEAAIVAGIAPLLIPAVIEALKGVGSGLTESQVQAATESAVRRVFADAAS